MDRYILVAEATKNITSRPRTKSRVSYWQDLKDKFHRAMHPMSSAMDEGSNAFWAKKPRSSNPYSHGNDTDRRDWDEGWSTAEEYSNMPASNSSNDDDDWNQNIMGAM